MEKPGKETDNSDKVNSNSYSKVGDLNIKSEGVDENKMFVKIWRGPDGKDGRPSFLMACPLCEVVLSDLVSHIKWSHKGTDWRGIKTICPFEDCGKDVVDIQNHIRKVHLKIKNFGCDLCDAKFSNRGQVEKHVNGVHSSLREKCPHCDTMLKVTTMKAHIRNVHENVKPRIACTEEDCEKTFLSKSDMNRHIASVHEKLKFPCPECGKNFHIDFLKKHIQMIHKQIYPYFCKQCGKGFQVLKDLHTHIRTKHYGDFMICENLNSNGEMCGKKLRNEEALQKHVDRVHLKTEDIKNPKVTCPECGVNILKESLQRHIDTLHLKIKNRPCMEENCGLIFTSNQHLKKHVDKVHNKIISREWCDLCEEFKENLKAHNSYMHKSRKKVACSWPQCEYQAKTGYLVQQHIKNVHEEKTRVKCDECGKSTKDLYGHKKTAHRKVEDIYFCQECDKGFPQKNKLRNHINQIHLKLRCTCPECGKDLAAGHLKNHIRFVHEKRIGKVCDVPGCDTTFINNATKLKHIEQVHKGIRNTCPECGKQVSDLRHHVKVVHKKERPHECQECKKTYQTRTHLQNHMKTFHLGIRVKCEECGKMVLDIYSHRAYAHKEPNFPCDQCATKCTNSTALKMHILSVHLGVKEHCEICNKDVAAGYLTTHIKNHTKTEQEKKPHNCQQCEKSFKDPGTLKKHIERTHLNQKEECPKCGLETKDLYRHMKYTNCESEAYTPRRRRIVDSDDRRERGEPSHSYFPASLADDQAIDTNKVKINDQGSQNFGNDLDKSIGIDTISFPVNSGIEDNIISFEDF